MTWIPDKTVDRLRELAEMPDLTGTGYRLIERIAHGGMGVVWLAHDESLDRQVALKVLDIPVQHEAQVLAKLEHPGIVPVHSTGYLPDGRLFYTMKFVQGERLDAFVSRVPTTAERLRLVMRICEAVAFAHAGGVLHRDLKPDNIMVGPFGEVLVMDWGLAILQKNSVQVCAGGTVGYMAPEQARGGTAALDERVDIYSLGAILRFLLDGRNPDRPLRAIVNKATAESPASRYASVTALSSDIESYVDGLPVIAYRETLIDRARRFLRKHRLAVGVVAAYAVVRLLMHLLFGA